MPQGDRDLRVSDRQETTLSTQYQSNKHWLVQCLNQSPGKKNVNKGSLLFGAFSIDIQGTKLEAVAVWSGGRAQLIT